MVALMSVVAVRLLRLKSLARTSPDIPAQRVVPRVWLQMLKLARKGNAVKHFLGKKLGFRDSGGNEKKARLLRTHN